MCGVPFVFSYRSWTEFFFSSVYSINGENKHYGTPVNPAATSRVPGGSSSGSAVAVAAELVDFALGMQIQS
jgi:Asp-tRNA(Asn)/Glu-tRNA(Gln) amidotransferase A subunit family amidase